MKCRLFPQTRLPPTEQADGRALLAVRLLQDGRVRDGGDGLRAAAAVRGLGRAVPDRRLPQRQPGEAERVAVPTRRLRDEAVSPVLGRDGAAAEMAVLGRRARAARLPVDVLHLRLLVRRRVRRPAERLAPSPAEHARDGRREEAYAIAAGMCGDARLLAVWQGQCLDADYRGHATFGRSHSGVHGSDTETSKAMRY